MRNKPRKKQTGVCFGIGYTSLILVFLTCVAFSFSFYYFKSNGYQLSMFNSVPDHSLIEYEKLLQRAQSLRQRIKNMTDSASLLQLASTSSTDNNLNSIISQSNLRNPSTTGAMSPKVIAGHPHDTIDLVIGMAKDIDPKNFAIFCYSLREVSKSSEVVIFVNLPISPRILEISRENNIQLYSFDLSSLPRTYINYHPSTLRWKMIYEYLSFASSSSSTSPSTSSTSTSSSFSDSSHSFLASLASSSTPTTPVDLSSPSSSSPSTSSSSTSFPKKFGQILMIDVRDSYFQSDPFTTIHPPDTNTQEYFLAFRGVENLPISQCGWNGGWVEDCFGSEILDEIGSQPIICSGVSLGTYSSVLSYLHSMSSLIQGPSSPSTSSSSLSLPTSKFPTCERNGVDQGVHNVLVHKKLIPNLYVFPQSISLIANMQAKVASIITTQEGEGKKLLVQNSKKELVSIVHQYDRFPNLQSYLMKKYVHWVDATDPIALWKSENACNSFSYKPDSDLFKGRCDYKMQGGASDASVCCPICLSSPQCRSFTFYSGTCFFKTCRTEPPLSASSSRLEGAVSSIKLTA